MTPPPVDPWLRAALGNDPFPWQSRLLAELRRGAWPRSLDLPTGLGKTAVMAIWLVARARGAAHLPRRLVYVVDRRAVVDQATRVAEGLRAFVDATPEVRAALGLSRPLPISTLRGQFADNREWLTDPTAPAIVVGTVDMIGSRLLFEGYACSRKMRPYHAGLLATDTVLVLDEAHLVPPFERLLDQIPAPTYWPTGPIAVPPIRLVSLSATGRDTRDPFRLDAADTAHDVVKRRVGAVKRATWASVPKGGYAEEAARRAWGLATAAGAPARVLVFCNARTDAEKAKDAVLKRAAAERGRGGALPATSLLVGGRRVRERTDAERTLQSLGFVASDDRAPLTDHVFLFATSAGEVGVDLDADHLVADVVAWERMVQRLGRVNRRGEREASVVFLAEEGSPWADPVRALFEALPEDGDARRVGPAALGALRELHPDRVRKASTPEPSYPALSLPLVEAWAMTSLREHTGRPEVAPWLRGWVDDEPQTTVVWRDRVTAPLGCTLDAWFEAVPVHLSEGLEAESWRVAEWLTGRAEKLGREAGDGRPADADVVALVLDDGVEDRWTLAELVAAKDAKGRERLTARLTGRTLVVDRRLGGLSAEGLLDGKADAPAPALDDPAAPWEGAPYRVAVDPGEERGWQDRLRVPRDVDGDEEVTSWLVVQKQHQDGATEDDRSTASRPQGLGEHQAWTRDEAERMVRAYGAQLPDDVRAAVVLAAALHDEGKRSARWQRAFSARGPDAPYAKTAGPVRVALLDGYRHELGSLPYLEQSPAFAALSGDARELALHLVAAHHGFARPLIATSGCDDVPPSQVELRARAVALRYLRLQQRWGPWRLAWLEALVRAADQSASRRNDEEVR
jgi:CRISPR-associated endonuclease/helicase Cas3